MKFKAILLCCSLAACTGDKEEFYTEVKVVDSVWVSEYSKRSTLQFEPIYYYTCGFQKYATKRKVHVGDTVYHVYIRK